MPFEESLNRYWYGAKEDPDPDNFRRTNINNCLSYFYSLNEVNKMKKVYEYANDFKSVSYTHLTLPTNREV